MPRMILFSILIFLAWYYSLRYLASINFRKLRRERLFGYTVVCTLASILTIIAIIKFGH